MTASSAVSAPHSDTIAPGTYTFKSLTDNSFIHNTNAINNRSNNSTMNKTVSPKAKYISFRLRSLTCNGLHDKTQVRMKLQNNSQHTRVAKNLGDHTHQTFDFQTTVHNMTFDTIKIDVFDVKKAFNQHVKIGRAYLSLRDLQKKVGNVYDNDGDDNTEPEQSVLSSRFDAAAFCKKHDDVFEIDLPLFKHGSYSKFGSSVVDGKDKGQDVVVTKGSERGKDISEIDHRPRPARSDSFAQMAMNGVEVGMVTVQATLHFKDQTQNPLFAHLGKSVSEPAGVQRNLSRKLRSNTNHSMDSTLSSDSSTLGDNHLNNTGYYSDQHLSLSSSSDIEPVNIPAKSASAPIFIPHNAQSGNQQQQPTRILQNPSSPPNLSLHYGPVASAGSPISPPLSPTLPHSPVSPTSPQKAFHWLSENSIPQSALMSWKDSELNHGDGFADGEGGDYEEDILSTMKGQKHIVKGENLTDADRKREEDLMAEIMANGNQAKKNIYLNRSEEGSNTQQHPKGKKPKFTLFSEQTRSAFKDIQLMYSSFFGHGWNLTRSEFWRGFHIVEQYYALRPTPTTNRAFDNIEILEKARHFVRLAIASYGSLPWVYFGYSFKVAPLNFVRFNSDRKNVMDYFKLKKEDMIVWHFDKRTALVPSYYIVRDPKYNALCIIIRGTFSITDAMTDLVCEYYPYKGGLVHKGIMDNARFVLERSGKDIEAALKKFNLKTIYCIGHSLGGGSASLLCSLLQDQFADYVIPATPNPKEQKLEIKAYLFAPPPICTPNLAADWERTQIAFINESDIVCRLSYGNALDLKELIKIAALESLNPIYKGMGHNEKLEQILKVLEKAQKSLSAVDDVPRLVIGGTITYLHKVYEDTPVIQNKRHDRGSKFGLPENWSEDSHSTSLNDQKASLGRSRGMSVSSSVTHGGQNTLQRSLTALTAALTLKNNANKNSHHGESSPNNVMGGSDDNGSISSSTGGKVPIVTPYQPNQPPVRLTSSVSLALSDLNERHDQQTPVILHPQEPLVDSPLELPSAKRNSALGEPIHYVGSSNARDLATQRILNDSRQGIPQAENRVKNGRVEDEEEEGDESEDEWDEDAHKIYTTQKPRKNGSKKKEIRIEFSDKEHFMAIPLRANWLWHHFPQQYDSRMERALAWAKAHKEKEDRKQQQREQRREKRDRKGATESRSPGGYPGVQEQDYFSV
ncbi:hypothetical protein EDD11_010345 [Mortierella claussenii]|nr:hypothetical protein EDD11_010345 [Mortierella claussenii]